MMMVLSRGEARTKSEGILPSDSNAPTGITGGQNPGKIVDAGWRRLVHRNVDSVFQLPGLSQGKPKVIGLTSARLDLAIVSVYRKQEARATVSDSPQVVIRDGQSVLVDKVWNC
jgi:hypothetical protein